MKRPLGIRQCGKAPSHHLMKIIMLPIGDEYTWWLGGDYIGYTSYRPLYDRYVKA
jgi:hypothetical protein